MPEIVLENFTDIGRALDAQSDSHDLVGGRFIPTSSLENPIHPISPDWSADDFETYLLNDRRIPDAALPLTITPGDTLDTIFDNMDSLRQSTGKEIGSYLKEASVTIRRLFGKSKTLQALFTPRLFCIGEENTVSYSPGDLPSYKHPRESVSLISGKKVSIHEHPNYSPPSGADILDMLEPVNVIAQGVMASFILGPNKRYLFIRREGGMRVGFLEADDVADDINKEFRDRRRALLEAAGFDSSAVTNVFAETTDERLQEVQEQLIAYIEGEIFSAAYAYGAVGYVSEDKKTYKKAV